MFPFLKKKTKPEFTPFRKEHISGISTDTQHGVMFEWCEVSDGSYNQVFSDNYMKVYRQRGKQPKDTKIDHPLTGKKITLVEDGKEREVWVESVHKHWYWGYYLVILFYTVMDNGGHSHGTRTFENINCHFPIILDDIEENQKNIKY
jgi:hypothetical protein